jgi:hypothetical protein
MDGIEKEIIRLLEHSPGLSDRMLTEATQGYGSSFKFINQKCQALKKQGVIYRDKREDGLIGNWLKEDSFTNSLARRIDSEARVEDIPEKKIKQVLEAYLTSGGWKPEITWGKSHGIDIDAKRGKHRWIIQVKGSTSFPSVVINNFLSALGEITQRMDDPDCKYSIALPESEPFRRLWERLPKLARSRLQVTALFVNPAGKVVEEA